MFLEEACHREVFSNFPSFFFLIFSFFFSIIINFFFLNLHECFRGCPALDVPRGGVPQRGVLGLPFRLLAPGALQDIQAGPGCEGPQSRRGIVIKIKKSKTSLRGKFFLFMKMHSPKFTVIRRLTVREAGASRHHGGPILGPVETSLTIKALSY